MPYAIKKTGSMFTVTNSETGKVHGHHKSKAKAKKQLAALYANAPG
jgi:hypothetical protein